MDEPSRNQTLRRLSTPRAAAVAGILFAVMFASSLVLLRNAVPADPFADISWVTNGDNRIRAALVLAPLCGIAFLWFIGVIRDQLGNVEDRFSGRSSLAADSCFSLWWPYRWPSPVRS